MKYFTKGLISSLDLYGKYSYCEHTLEMTAAREIYKKEGVLDIERGKKLI